MNISDLKDRNKNRNKNDRRDDKNSDSGRKAKRGKEVRVVVSSSTWLISLSYLSLYS